jgi:hypothetical protein
VIPIAKISDPLELKDYKPISILPALSKAVKMVMRDQIVSFLDCARALDRFQSSFRKCHSTVKALLGVSDDIYRMSRKWLWLFCCSIPLIMICFARNLCDFLGFLPPLFVF